MRCRKPFHGCGRNASAAKDRYTKRCVCVCARARARARVRVRVHAVARVRACERVCARVCARACVCVRA